MNSPHAKRLPSRASSNSGHFRLGPGVGDSRSAVPAGQALAFLVLVAVLSAGLWEPLIRMLAWCLLVLANQHPPPYTPWFEGP